MEKKKVSLELDKLITKTKNDLLKEIIEHHHYCQHCKHNLPNVSCLFAYECITQDFYFYYDDDDE